MPRMDGREVLRRLRRSRVWTPTILLTQVGASVPDSIRAMHDFCTTLYQAVSD